MYFATLTEVPILQGLIANGMGQGPALALLLAGPALSLPNMLVIRSIMGTKKTKDQHGNTWQAIAFKRIRPDGQTSFDLRLVGFPGVADIDFAIFNSGMANYCQPRIMFGVVEPREKND
jgi:hypothetical protein